MRRWLALFLFVLMPLQFTWGVAAAYCGHEGGPERSREPSSLSAHFGHHEHQHESAAAADPQADKLKLGKQGSPLPDNDCDYCHLGAAKPLALVPAPLPLPGAQTLVDTAEPPFSSRAPDHPDRPNWRIA